MYKIDTRYYDNLILFRVFKILFPKSTIADLHATKHNSVVVKTHNQFDIEHPGMCTVEMRHKDKCVRCRFFEVPDDSPGILKHTENKVIKEVSHMKAGSLTHKQ